MCCKLTNRRYCLLVGSLVGVAQLLVAIPIMVLSLLVLLGSELGHALSPYWAASLVSYYSSAGYNCCVYSEGYTAMLSLAV